MNRPTRYLEAHDGTYILRVPCQGTIERNGEQIACQAERRYDSMTLEQIEAYTAGAPLGEVWAEPDAYVADPWCAEHAAQRAEAEKAAALSGSQRVDKPTDRKARS